MSDPSLFKWRHFQADIILCAVRWYLRYALRYRDVEELLRERGISVDHTTIFRWVQRYAPELDKRCRPHLNMTNDSYRVDETSIKIKKQWYYLYRAIDSTGATLDFMLSATRDADAAECFFRSVPGNAKDHGTVLGTVCLAFPDTYALGMSHHGLQVLYSLMNARDWACERVFTPLPDFEAGLRAQGLPLYSLETFTPLHQFDVIGFSLQYEICYTNVLTMLDLGGIALHAEERGCGRHTCHRRRAGGTESRAARPVRRPVRDRRRRAQPAGRLRPLAGDEGFGTLPRGEAGPDRHAAPPGPTCPASTSRSTARTGRSSRSAGSATTCPAAIRPCVIQDLEGTPLPTRPIVPFVETAHDRIAIEIMRGCPWQCRFCQSTVIKRPLRYRTVETIVQSAPRELQEHGIRRDQPALPLDLRLSALRGAGDADERGVHAPGGEDLAAQPADHRDAEEDPRALAGGPAKRTDACARGRPR